MTITYTGGATKLAFRAFRIGGRRFGRAVRLFTCVMMMAAGCATATAQLNEPGGTAEAARTAVQNPDEYAWQLFLFINHQSKVGVAGVADPDKKTIGDYDDDRPVIWETWALASREGQPEAEVFLAKGAKPSPWTDLPRAQMPAKRLDHTFTLIGQEIAPPGHSRFVPAFAPNEPEADEVRINEATLGAIRSQRLYSREGLAAAFALAKKTGNRDLIQFPPAAKEVKARWAPISDQDKGRYHWRTIGGQAYGLVAFHIITKDTPMWFWTDFLHEDFASNEPPGSFHDSTTLGANAPHGQGGIRAETAGSKWAHYRLKGSQLTFHDARGTPTILGNEVIESGNAAVSSCITCHASAGVNAQGQFRGAGFQVGAPPATNFTVNNVMQRLQTDFLYSIPLRAQQEASDNVPAAPESVQPDHPSALGILESPPVQPTRLVVARDTALIAALSSSGFNQRAESLFRLSKRWFTGQTVTVAFKGGDKSLHARIAAATKDWTDNANIKLDFGLDPISGEYRQWSAAKDEYTADIRVSFDKTGYYSQIGTDSISPGQCPPGKESLNLQGFDRGLPFNWRGIVLHEFGHALGFEHEHEQTNSPCDFRWEDDVGYEKTVDRLGQFIPDRRGRWPGIYTLLGGPPNRWERDKVDFNLRPFPASSAFDASEFDRTSIMLYSFPPELFVSGRKSPCCTPDAIQQLSVQDKAGVSRAYPFQPAAANEMLVRQRQVIKALKELKLADPALKQHVKSLQSPP